MEPNTPLKRGFYNFSIFKAKCYMSTEKKANILLILILTSLFSCTNDNNGDVLPSIISIDVEDKTKWILFKNYEFDQSDKKELFQEWIPQNSATTHTLCSRWEENVEVNNGTVKLVAKKESRGGQDWTAASIWTKEDFQYGYFECKYKYAAASGTNNSFWLFSLDRSEFEIDINEGHYPNKLNTNIHYWNVLYPMYFSYKEANFSQGYNLFGLEWNESELIYYINRGEIRRIKNTGCFSPAKIYLSLAIFEWAGAVTDAIDGKYMEIEYVRVYKPVASED